MRVPETCYDYRYDGGMCEIEGRCKWCGKVLYVDDDFQTIDDGNIICKDCSLDMTICDRCGRIVHPFYDGYFENGEVLCEECCDCE